MFSLDCYLVPTSVVMVFPRYAMRWMIHTFFLLPRVIILFVHNILDACHRVPASIVSAHQHTVGVFVENYCFQFHPKIPVLHFPMSADLDTTATNTSYLV